MFVRDRVRYLQLSRTLEGVADASPRWELPQRRPGRFAFCTVMGRSKPGFDVERAEAAQRAGLPARHPNWILF